MKEKDNSRRDFLFKSFAASSLLTFSSSSIAAGTLKNPETKTQNIEDNKSFKKETGSHDFNGPYTGKHLDRIAFPIGGIGTGSFSIEGSGAISQMSIHHKPEVYNEPCTFAALHIKGPKSVTKVLEGKVPDWKKFGQTGGKRSESARGAGDNSFGLPRFKKATFKARFPFCEIDLEDDEIPLEVSLKGWSPFIPSDEDASSLPSGAIEYSFKNSTLNSVSSVFSWNAKNFMQQKTEQNKNTSRIRAIDNGFILEQPHVEEAHMHQQGAFAAFISDNNVTVDHCWFRGGWFDSLSVAWEKLSIGDISENIPVPEGAPGASIYLPFTLSPGEEKTICLKFVWYVPYSEIRFGPDTACEPNTSCSDSKNYRPWYAGKFHSIESIAKNWNDNYDQLNVDTSKFTEAFFKSTLNPEVLEAVSANLSIIKSPTVLRQTDGNLWAYEGCNDDWGCCTGSCTHVWNYAQAIAHLFPALERTLRNTEFNLGQNDEGHQNFRVPLPIRLAEHGWHAASDGQLGGIIKVYRDWRISGETDWLLNIYPLVKKSLDYCIKVWDPKERGILEEPHHNTYDVEFWGPNGMCTSFYLGALTAMTVMSKALSKPFKKYSQLLKKGTSYMENELFDGEYFIQKIQWTGLEAKDPVELSKSEANWNTHYSDEALAILEKEGPKYQYGKGCLSDGIIGMWMASCSGLEEATDNEKVTSHLKAVYKYNMKDDLSDFPNPQRPTYAMGNEGGLLLCSWPKGGKLTLPFVYSNEVWTGIEYQVASHLIMKGLVHEGLEIIRACRKRYDGSIRNPFDEYECGHWYARAMASYSLLQALTGIRYDAIEKTLYIDSKVGSDFTSFLSTNTGFGNVGLKNNKPVIDIKYGEININQIIISGKKYIY